MVPPYPRGGVRDADCARAGRAARPGLALAAGCKLPVLRHHGLAAGTDPMPRRSRCGAGVPDVAGDPGNRGRRHETVAAGPNAVLGTGPVAGESDCGWRDPRPLVTLANRYAGPRP